MKRLIGLTLLLTYLCAGAETSIPDMKFRRLDTRDGLSNSTINCIYQDSKGFVWIGTSYGLNRYDGYRFRTYYSDPNDTTTLRSNYVDQIFEDAAGRLWLRQGMNYSLFDPVTERKAMGKPPEPVRERFAALQGFNMDAIAGPTVVASNHAHDTTDIGADGCQLCPGPFCNGIGERFG